MKITSFLVAGLLALGNIGAPWAVAHAENDPVDPKLTQRITEEEPISAEDAQIEAGHVDLGPRIAAGKWQIMLRDSSKNKAVWRDPNKTVFKVGSNSQMEVPVDEQFSFLPQGEKVYVLPQQEVARVPWLGWNTQSPEVVKVLKSGAKLTFLGHQGPGKFSLFVQSGNFGRAQVLWQSTKKEPQDIFIESNAHTHANWVFTKPGIHLVKVGISADSLNGKAVNSETVLRFAVGGDTNVSQVRGAVWDETNKSGASEIKNNSVYVGYLIAIVVIGSLMAAAAIYLSYRRSRLAKLQAQGEASKC